MQINPLDLVITEIVSRFVAVLEVCTGFVRVQCECAFLRFVQQREKNIGQKQYIIIQVLRHLDKECADVDGTVREWSTPAEAAKKQRSELCGCAARCGGNCKITWELHLRDTDRGGRKRRQIGESCIIWGDPLIFGGST
jgi:hypothetical protein